MNDPAFEKELQAYYKKVRRLLVGSRSQRNKMMQAMQGDVDAFLESRPDADMDAVQQHFGTVQKLGDDMVAGMEPQELRRYVRRINAWNWFVAAFIIVTIVVALSIQIQKVLYALEDRDNVIIGTVDGISAMSVPDENENNPVKE